MRKVPLQHTFGEGEPAAAGPGACRRAWLQTFVWTSVFCCLAAGAALFPKLMRQVPVELRGDYVLLLKMNPNKTHEEFTNAPPFATFMSNRVVLAHGQVRTVDGLMRVRQKGTNVYMVSFQDKSTWLITQPPSSSQLVVLEPLGKDSKDATIFVLEANPAVRTSTNAVPADARSRVLKNPVTADSNE